MEKFSYDYPRPAVTADVAVLRLEELPEILLVKRKDPSFQGSVIKAPGCLVN